MMVDELLRAMRFEAVTQPRPMDELLTEAADTIEALWTGAWVCHTGVRHMVHGDIYDYRDYCIRLSFAGTGQ